MRKQPSLRGQCDQVLERMVAFLNGEEYVERRGEEDYDVEHMQFADTKELRELVGIWLICEGNWPEFLKKVPGKRRALAYGTFRIPNFVRAPVVIPRSAKEATHAQRIFLEYILHSTHWRVCAPCRRKKCGRYYLRGEKRTRFFCSRKCAGSDAAQRGMQKAREEYRNGQLERVREAIAQWQRNPAGMGMKNYIEIKTRVTPRMLAGWINKGYLELPKGVGRTKA
jgi:hypothetical protein